MKQVTCDAFLPGLALCAVTLAAVYTESESMQRVPVSK